MNVHKKLFLIFILISFFVLESHSQPNLVFNVNSNPSINVGLKMQKLLIFLGTNFSYDSQNSETKFLTDVKKDEYSVFSITPGIGIKFYLYDSEFSPFISGLIKKEIPFSIDVKGEMSSKSNIEDRYDDLSFRISGGGDFKIKESLLLGFELGLNIWPHDYKSEISETKSIHINTFSNVTLTYVFQ